MTEKINAYSYLRISSDKQKVGDGIRRQMDASKEYAEQHGYNLVETMSDIRVSAFKGKNTSEGTLGLFLDAINTGKIKPGSVLIVESLDRLSRDKVLKAFSLFTSILEKGIGIITLVDDQHYTTESVSDNFGQLFMSLGIMIRANDESVTKSKRIKAAWQRKRDTIGQRKMTSNVPAWLYLSDDRSEVLIDEAKAETIRHIFDLSIKGLGTYSVAKQLNGNPEKYPPITRSKKWSPSYIKNILDSPATWGSFQPHEIIDGTLAPSGDLVLDYYPSIISKDTFNLAQSRTAGRVTGAAGKKGEHFSNLFSGMLYCGSCGGALYLRGNNPKKRKSKFIRCSNSLYNLGCSTPGWNYHQFETAFMRFAQGIKFSELLGEKRDEQENLQAQIATAQTKLAELDASYKALVRQFENPDLPELLMKSLITRSMELETQIAGANQTIGDLEMRIAEQSSDNMDAEQQDFLTAYEVIEKSGEPDQLREIRFAMNNLLRRTVEHITIFNSMTVNPWEVPDALSDQLIRSLGPMSDEELEAHFSKPHGKRQYIESERYFLVKFKSGAARVVHPYSGTTYMSVSERLADMRKGA